MSLVHLRRVTPEQLDEVWSMIDRTYLSDVAHRGPTPIFATVSGAHLYGFASPDSDVDLRGAFLAPARAVLGLHPQDDEWLSGQAMAGVWFATVEDSAAHQRAMSVVPHGRYKALAVSPLTSGRLDPPDICLFYGTPGQTILFVNGLQHGRYRRYDMSITGESACADSWGRALYRNHLLFQWAREILGRFQVAGIDCIVLKGAALVRSIGFSAGFRPMADVDLLVRLRDARRAMAVAAAVGMPQRTSRAGARRSTPSPTAQRSAPGPPT